MCVCLLALSLLFICSEHRKNTNGNMQSVTTWKKKAKKSNGAESFKHMKIKYPTHLKMAM
jgi:hypothetical protein